MSFFSIGKLILYSLFKKESTLAYPVKPMPKDELVRGHVGIEIESCIFCGICQRKCPTDAIHVIKPEKSWQISRFQCIVCNSCIEACPKKCLKMYSELTPAADSCVTDTITDARISSDA